MSEANGGGGQNEECACVLRVEGTRWEGEELLQIECCTNGHPPALHLVQLYHGVEEMTKDDP